MTVMFVLGLLFRSPSDTCLMDEDAVFLCKAVRESWYWNLFYLFKKTSCLILTVVIVDTFSVKLLAESLKAWKEVMHPLFYPLL